VAKSVAYENEEAAAGDALLQVHRPFFPTRVAHILISKICQDSNSECAAFAVRHHLSIFL
jgi:hypothetical protein